MIAEPCDLPRRAVGSTTIAGMDPSAAGRFAAALLEEDLGIGGDVTSRLTVAEDATLSAVLRTREDIVLAGMDLAAIVLTSFDRTIAVRSFLSDGDRVDAGQILAEVRGPARSVLAAERSALNLLQHLCGIATLTRRYADAIEGTGCILLDTRKTVPGLRVIEKYAARIGGAHNHRMRLDDGILIKDNHVALCGGVGDAVRAAKSAGSGFQVQVEVDRIDQIEPALAAGADRLLCDNMTPDQLAAAVQLVAGRVPIEASGGVRLDTIRAIAESGVDFVSVGRITQSAPAADIGLDYALVD